MNSLAYSAQGAEVELAWQPRPHFLFRGGYTYLDAQGDAIVRVGCGGGQPGRADGESEYSGSADWGVGSAGGGEAVPASSEYGILQRAIHAANRMAFSITGAMASESDDSTYLEYEDLNGGNTLLLPNRNLDFGYIKLDMDSPMR